MENGASRDELKNGRGRGWAVAYQSVESLQSMFLVRNVLN